MVCVIPHFRHALGAGSSHAAPAHSGYAGAIRRSVVYLVLSHTAPELVARLADRLLRGDEGSQVVVDHDVCGPPLIGLPTSHPRLSTRTSRRDGGWGSYALVAAVIDALEMINRELDPGWVVLLSGQDYPVVSPAEVRHRLAAADADVRMSVLCRLSEASEDSLRHWHARYFFAWARAPLPPFQLSPRLRQRRINLEHRLSMAQRHLFVWTLPRGAGTRVGLRRRVTPFSTAYPCWGAAQWFALSGKALDVLERELDARPELIAHYQRSLIPDESMLQTMLLNAPELTTGEPSLTFARHTGRDSAHADVLDLRDLDEIVESGRAFARKMDPVRSTSLMDALDRRIGLADAVEA